MVNRKPIFPPLPDFVREHPKALEYRVERIEEHLEQSRRLSSGIPDSWLPLIAQALLWVFGLLCLGSPEKANELLRLFGG